MAELTQARAAVIDHLLRAADTKEPDKIKAIIADFQGLDAIPLPLNAADAYEDSDLEVARQFALAWMNAASPDERGEEWCTAARQIARSLYCGTPIDSGIQAHFLTPRMRQRSRLRAWLSVFWPSD